MNHITQRNHAKRCQFVCCINSHLSCPHIVRISQEKNRASGFTSIFICLTVNFARLSTPHQCFYFAFKFSIHSTRVFYLGQQTNVNISSSSFKIIIVRRRPDNLWAKFSSFSWSALIGELRKSLETQRLSRKQFFARSSGAELDAKESETRAASGLSFGQWKHKNDSGKIFCARSEEEAEKKSLVWFFRPRVFH
jgi:hypothetical protein